MRTVTLFTLLALAAGNAGARTPAVAPAGLEVDSETLAAGEAATNELASASAAHLFEYLARLKAPPRPPRPDGPRPGAGPAPFNEPDAGYLKEMYRRIERTAYDRRIKDLMRFMVENSYQEDGRVAIDAVEKLKPEIKLGDTSSPFAGGEAWGDADKGEHKITVDDKGLDLKLPPLWEGSNDFFMWEAPKSYADLYGFVPQEIIRRKERELSVPLEYAAGTLLHEIFHRATAVDGGESTLVTEMRSHLAEHRMTFLMERKWGGSRRTGPWKDESYLEWKKDPQAYEESLIKLYVRDFGKIDLRADEIETKRQDILAKLKLGDFLLEREKEAERRKLVKDYVDHLRRHAYQLWVLGLMDQDEKGRANAALDAREENILREHFASEEYRKEYYRRTLERRLERLAADERMYREIRRLDRAWRETIPK